MSKNLKTQWRVQVRKSRAHKWVNKGLYETRFMARHTCWIYREIDGSAGLAADVPPVGFGNTRVVKYVRAGK